MKLPLTFFILLPFIFSNFAMQKKNYKSPKSRSASELTTIVVKKILARKKPEEIKDSLKEMVSTDQELRKNYAKETDITKKQELALKIKEKNSAHIQNLKEIIVMYGWPTYSKFGKESAHHAWLILQHADHDTEFQKKGLEYLSIACQNKEAAAEDFAFLCDRLLINQSLPQYYGTQVNHDMQLFPVEGCTLFDTQCFDIIDQRRKALGLTGIREYLVEIHQLKSRFLTS